MEDTIAQPDAPFAHGEAEAAASDLMTRDEVADWLRVSLRTVRRLTKAGELEEVLVSPRSPRIRAASVDRHLEQHRQAVSAA